MSATRARLARLALIDGHTTVLWWCTGIYAAGAIITGTPRRHGPLTRPADVPALCASGNFS